MRAEQRGFVLLEAVVALMIVTVVGFAVLSTISAQLRSTARAQALIIADALARDRLLGLETLTHRELESLPDSLTSGTFPPPLDGFRFEAHSTRTAQDTDLFDVIVSVDWNDGRHSLATLLYRPARRMDP